MKIGYCFVFAYSSSRAVDSTRRATSSGSSQNTSANWRTRCSNYASRARATRTCSLVRLSSTLYSSPQLNTATTYR